jgi:hypothetical protein
MARKPRNGPGDGAAAPLKPRKRLIVCYDGTWNTADNGGNPTNVVRIARSIPPLDDHGVHQIVFYEAGVGTGIFDRVIGGAFGEGLDQNIKNGYLFLAHNFCGGDEHHAPDEIYVFGFSRGAYTARSLCGFIGSCRGLLQTHALHKLERAWKFYRTKPQDRNKFEHYEDIEHSVRQDVRIKGLGIWDTVGALGVPLPWFRRSNARRYGFHDTELSRLVENAFHALAIDEQRGPFVPSLWQRPGKPIYGQIVEQVWFPGVHSNVGGSYPDTDLADLTLRWMVGRVTTHTDLRFTDETLDYLLPDRAARPNKAAIERLRSKWLGSIYESRSRAFFFDKWLPMLRVIAGQRPASKSLLQRIFPTDPCEPFEQAVHWSALDRYSGWSAESLESYAPKNLTWAWAEILNERVKVVKFADEIRKGKAWAGADAAAQKAGGRLAQRSMPAQPPDALRPPMH